MLRFSGGYLPINPNFVVGVKDKKTKMSESLDGVLAIIKNLMFRCGTIKASPFLEQQIGLKKKYGKYLVHNSPVQTPKWDFVIKGGDKVNPAKKFYNILKEQLPEYYFYFLPECPFSQIVPDEANIQDSAVDFYSPLFKTVVEIDGGQHKKQVAKTVDHSRDLSLRKHKINVIRIPSKDIYANDVSEYINKLRYIISNTELANYIEQLDEVEKSYLYAFRFQIAVLEAITNGLIDLDSKKVNLDVLLHDDKINVTLFENSLKDLVALFKNLYILNKESKVFPVFSIHVINNVSDVSNTNLTIDIKISEYYDQSIYDVPDNYICVRNDYFLYSDRGLIEDCSRYKNYYSLYSSKFRFSDVSKENKLQHEALLYFLNLIFRFQGFRSNQEDIVCNAFNTKKAVIGILPTGAGKSICYQFVGMLTPGLTLVISPLKSLMEDQCDNLYRDHLISAATYINSETSKSQKNLFYENKCKFVYISPERFFNPEFKEFFTKNAHNISQIVVDEVHCLSEWGHDFRTSYLLLFNFLKQSGLSNNTFLIGTTATASLQVINDIVVEFTKLNKVVVTEQSDTMSRPELKFGIYAVKSQEDRANIISSKVRKNLSNNEQTVVFYPFAKSLEDLKNKIELSDEETDSVATFHSKTPNQSEIISKLKTGQIKALVATTAFGMGIDVKHIRHTIHYCIGQSVESIYQEMGRAGRDGKPADCYICFQKDEHDFQLFQDHASDSGSFDFDSLYSQSELKQRLWLLKTSNFPPEADAEYSFYIYKVLEQSNGTVSWKDLEKEICQITEKSELLSKYKLSRSLFEKYLYRLYLLKLIDLWAITYSHDIENPTYSNLNIINRTNAEVGEALNTYIGLYEPGYNNQISQNISKSDYVKRALGILCKWNFENFFMCRWRSLATLYDMLYRFENSRSFADRINNYFSTNETLKAVADYTGVEDYHLWFKVLRAGTNLKKLKDQLARYLESPSCVYGIKFISAITRLQLKDFDSIEGKSRLKEVLDYIISRLHDENLFDDLMIYTLDFLPNVQDKLALMVFLINNYKDHIMTDKFINRLDSIKNNTAIKERIELTDLKDTLSEFRNTMEEINA